MDNTLISPSILSGDFANMGAAVKSVADWGGDLVHCDVMDGVYVPNITFGMPMVKALKRVSTLPLDVHLMITEPERYAESFIEAGADYLTFHPDASKRPLDTLRLIRSKGVKAGIVLNPNVPFDSWKQLVKECDLLLVMSVYAGFGGQSFIEDSLTTVRRARTYMDKHNLDIPIEIDGGVTEANAARIREAGVNILVAGSAVFKSANPSETIKKLRG